MSQPITRVTQQTEIGLTRANFSSVSEQPTVRIVASSKNGGGAVSSAVAEAASFSALAIAPAIEDLETPLLSPAESKECSARWDALQSNFVDDPRRVVRDAEALVKVMTTRLAEMFAADKAKLEGQWERGENVSTEDLRLALRRYRSFFGRLLSV